MDTDLLSLVSFDNVIVEVFMQFVVCLLVSGIVGYAYNYLLDNFFGKKQPAAESAVESR